MRRQQKTDEDYCPEVRLGAGDKDREPSISFASTEKKDDEYLLERILSRENMVKAFKRVKSNKGSSGTDGMTVHELGPYLNDHWPFIKAEILEGRYKPTAVRRVEIPKPNSGLRLLGIPTVLDRLIQQAIAQVLSEIYDNGFSETSYGFRPGRSTHQAVRQAKNYLNAGYSSVVDIDLEKFFDKVNHDKLLSVLSEKVKDKRVLKLIRLYLKSGIMIEGVVQVNEQGTPQGGPLSPLLSNILLDKLDKELESRGHKFCRYADDCSIYVRSPRAAERVLKSISQFLEEVLKLKVNHQKSGVRTPNQMKLLGFSFYRKAGEYRIRIADGAVEKLKQKLKPIVRRTHPISTEERIKKLKAITAGWANYFKVADAKSIFQTLDEWLRYRLRMCIWKAWKKPKTKVKNLRKLGLNEQKAYEYGNSRKGYCRVAQSPILKRTLTNNFFKQLGYTELVSVYSH